MTLTLGISGFAQSLSDYVMTTGTDATKWIQLTDTTSIISGTGDSKASAVTDIGFTFNFGGTNYTQFSVNSDGNLRLGGTVTGTSYYTTPFSSSSANYNNPKINMLGCDGYITDSGFVYHQVIGTAPDRVCVIEFATSTYATASRNSLLRWQVQLFETSNDIQIVFPSNMPPILPSVARQPGMCVNSSNIILIDASHSAAFYNVGQGTAHIPSGTWPDVDRYYLFVLSDCQSVSNLQVSNITTEEAEFNWSAPSDATGFVFEYKTADEDWDDATSLTTTDTFFSINGLLPNTYYNVRVANDCGSEQSNWTLVTFKTECTSISELPYIEDFEGYADYTTPPDCWTLLQTYSSTSYTYPYINNSSSTAHNGTGYLYSYGGNNFVALPHFTESVNNLRLTFWMKPAGTTTTYGHVEVGVMSDINDASSFQMVAAFYADSIGSTAWKKYMVDFNEVNTSDSDYIVIRRYVNSTYGWYFDDIAVDYIPQCEAPTQLAVVNATPNTATLFWNPGEGSLFTVYYKEVTDSVYSEVTNVTLDGDSTYTLMNLETATNYNWYVATLCDDGTETASDPSTFATTMIPVDLPYSTDFAEESDQNWLLNNGSCVNYWTMGAVSDTSSALFITTDGTTAGYTISSAISTVSASKLFTVGTASQLQISFDVKIGGESSFDYMKALPRTRDRDIPGIHNGTHIQRLWIQLLFSIRI